MTEEEITPSVLLAAYAQGYFPMAETRDAKELYWFTPEQRGILPLETFNVPRSLKKFLRTSPYEIRVDTCFPEVIRGCAERRDDSWINDRIVALFTEMAEMGFAHSVETFEDGKLVGGLYGLALGGAFFGESMFSRRPQASKVALVELVRLLKEAGYTLLDAQYKNQHLQQFGLIEIPRADYIERLEQALQVKVENAFV